MPAAPPTVPRPAPARRLGLALAGLVVAVALAGGTSGAVAAEGRARATFGGGCFWCLEPPFDEVPGVVSTTAGYAGGTTPAPTYEKVAAGRTDHAEVVQVVFDPTKVTYEQLLRVFWRNVDPFDAGGQFCDRGRQYRTLILYEGEDQKRAAEASRRGLFASGPLPAPIATEIAPLKVFFPAEAEHQDFYLRNVRQYFTYRRGCGRDERLVQLWGPTPAVRR